MCVGGGVRMHESALSVVVKGMEHMSKQLFLFFQPTSFSTRAEHGCTLRLAGGLLLLLRDTTLYYYLINVVNPHSLQSVD